MAAIIAQVRIHKQNTFFFEDIDYSLQMTRANRERKRKKRYEISKCMYELPPFPGTEIAKCCC